MELAGKCVTLGMDVGYYLEYCSSRRMLWYSEIKEDNLKKEVVRLIIESDGSEDHMYKLNTLYSQECVCSVVDDTRTLYKLSKDEWLIAILLGEV